MPYHDSLKLVKIQNFLLIGDYKKAQQVIKVELQKVKKKDEIYWHLVLLFSQCKFKMGHYSDSLLVIKEALSTLLVQENSFLMIDYLLLKCKNFDSLGRMDDVASIISEIDRHMNRLTTKDKKSVKFKEQIAQLYQLQGWYYIIKTKFESAEEILQTSKKLLTKLNNIENLALVNSNLGSMALRMGDRNKGLTLFQTSLKLREQIGNLDNIGLGKSLLGEYYRIIRDNKRSLAYHLESIKIFKKTGHMHHLANTYNSIGVTHLQSGDLNKASNYLSEALQILERIGNKRQIAFVLTNVGNVEKLRGNLDKALEAFLKGLKYFDQIGSIQNSGAQMLNIGDVYFRKGAYDTSLIYLQKGLEYRRRTGNTFYIAKALFMLVKIHSYINQYPEAKGYFQELKEILVNDDNNMLQQLVMLAEAFILKLENRSRSRVKAEDLLLEIISSDMIDFEIYLDAMLNLCELLVIELKITSSQEVLTELKDLLSKINKIAHYQQSYWLLAEVYWIQSHLDLLEWDIDSAQRSLTQAQIIAEEKGFDNLAMRISQDYDNIFSQIEIWEQLREKDAPLVERLEATKIDDLIKNLKKQVIDVEELPTEQPVMLLILKQTGQPIYHKTFLSQIESANESLLSAFISSINIFFSEVFKTSGAIERIKHKDLTILFKSVNTLMFCYVFKGQSYTAIKKLDEFIFTLQTNYEDLWKVIVSHLKTTELLKETPSLGLDQITNKVFLNNKTKS